MDPHDRSSKQAASFPWQAHLQINLETWRQISNNDETERIILHKKPLKLDLNYLQTYADRAKNSLKRRSQHELLLSTSAPL